MPPKEVVTFFPVRILEIESMAQKRGPLSRATGTPFCLARAAASRAFHLDSGQSFIGNEL